MQGAPLTSVIRSPKCPKKNAFWTSRIIPDDRVFFFWGSANPNLQQAESHTTDAPAALIFEEDSIVPTAVELTGQPISVQTWEDFVAAFARPTNKSEERRRSQRHRLRGTVRVKYVQNNGPHISDLDIINVSRGGITAKHWLPVSPDTGIEMQLMLDEITFRVTGKVVHCTTLPGGHRIGIRFNFPNP